MELQKFQRQKINELLKVFPRHTMTFMVDGIAIATQVEKSEFQNLNGRPLKYGDFEHKDGYMIHEDTKRIFIMSEELLSQHALFKSIKADVEFDNENLDFIVKKSVFDIDYLVRENHHVATHKFDEKEYFVFEKRPSCVGDATTVYVVLNH